MMMNTLAPNGILRYSPVLVGVSLRTRRAATSSLHSTCASARQKTHALIVFIAAFAQSYCECPGCAPAACGSRLSCNPWRPRLSMSRRAAAPCGAAALSLLPASRSRCSRWRSASASSWAYAQRRALRRRPRPCPSSSLSSSRCATPRAPLLRALAPSSRPFSALIPARPRRCALPARTLAGGRHHHHPRHVGRAARRKRQQRRAAASRRGGGVGGRAANLRPHPHRHDDVQ